MCISTRLLATPLGFSVCIIIGFGAKKEVPGITTRWIVATMEDAETLRDRAVDHGPGNAVRSLFPSVYAHHTITIFIPASLPLPATVIIDDCDLGPESSLRLFHISSRSR